jgi:hypothetical protein
MSQTSTQSRVLAVSLSTRGFGYAVIEGKNTIIDYGKKRISGDKNAGSLASMEKVITRNQPEILVLQDVQNCKGTKRVARIKKLYRKIVTLAKKLKIKVVTISGKELRAILLGKETGTKQEMAELLAKQFPDELASLLPPKRKAWKSEDSRMDIFDPMALAVGFRMKEGMKGQ